MAPDRAMAAALAVVLAFGLALGAACSGTPSSNGASPTGVGPCEGRVLIRDSDELRRVASCATIRGHIVLSGAALEHAEPLGQLRSVVGSIHIGPTLTLGSVDILSDLVAIDGSLTIESNLSADGVYLPALRRVSGDVTVARNTAMTGINAPVLERVGGHLAVTDNPSVARLDLSALERVSGNLDISRNTSLDTIALPRLAEVGGHAAVDDNPALPDPLPDSLGTWLDPAP